MLIDEDTVNRARLRREYLRKLQEERMVPNSLTDSMGIIPKLAEHCNLEERAGRAFTALDICLVILAVMYDGIHPESKPPPGLTDRLVAVENMARECETHLADLYHKIGRL